MIRSATERLLSLVPADHALTVLAFARSTNGFYFGGLLAGLNREVAAAGGRVVVVQTLDPTDVAEVVVRMPTFDLPLAWDEVDGAVAISLAVDAPVLRRLQDAGKPVVLTHRIEGFEGPLVLPNNRGSVFAAVDHLIAHGHTRIGFVGQLVQADMIERHEAYREALTAHGLVVDEAHLFETSELLRSGEAGRHVAARVAAADNRPTALVVATDREALDLLKGLAVEGVRVPHDIAVIAFDDLEASVFSTPTLSSVSQQFDEVGALAGRLLMAQIRGERPPGAPLTPPAAVVAGRGSCGCTPDPLASDDEPVRGVDTPPEVLREQLTAMLRETLTHGLSDRPVDPGAIRDAVAAVEHLTARGEPTTSELRGLLSTIVGLGHRPDLLHHVANTIAEYVQRTVGRAEGTVADLSTALWHLQASAYLSRAEGLERLLTEQFRIAAGLLHSSATDPRDLSWLSGSHVRAGLLALWTGTPADGRLEVVGVYDPDGAVGQSVGGLTSVTAFPPPVLVGLARPELGEACFVVPVQTSDKHWGLLAVVGDIDPTSSRAHYYYWAALLCSAFEEEQLEHDKLASEERYARVARAANDGLWEVDTATRGLYASARCRDLIGFDPGVDVDVDGWISRIHPDDAVNVRGSMGRALRAPDAPVEVEYRVRRGGDWRWVLSRGLGIASPDGGVARLVGSLSDIHPRKELEEQLRLGALYDAITGLPNRRLFLDRLSLALRHAERRPGARYAVIFLDLDGFKLVNDSLGHLVGDQLLTIVAERLRSGLRSVDTAARFGGDEFAVLLSDPVPDEVLVIARRIQERIAAPVLLAGHEVSVTASVGIATSDTGYSDPEDIVRDADIAMYEAKTAERGSASVFDREMHARASGRLQARTEVRVALAEQQFRVFYQPIVALDGSVLSHFEALVRWQHPARGLLLPGAFLPAMEDTSTVVTLGRWILDEVCRQIAEWNRVGLTATVAVNLSHQEFWSRDLVGCVRGALSRHGVPVEQLVLEITESVIMTDTASARDIMAALQGIGVQLHIDDFGTGQSSLHALRSFPVDALKIDGSFIRELCDVEQTSELVRIIIEIGRVLGMAVVAECVETADQAQRLRDMGCERAQGWLYAPALPGPDAGALLGCALAEVTSGSSRAVPGSIHR